MGKKEKKGGNLGAAVIRSRFKGTRRPRDEEPALVCRTKFLMPRLSLPATLASVSLVLLPIRFLCHCLSVLACGQIIFWLHRPVHRNLEARSLTV